MSLTEEKTLVETLFRNCKKYIENRIDFAILNAQDRLGDTLSSLASFLVVALLGFTTFLLVSLGLAFYIGKLLHALWAGLFIVAAFYFLLAVIIWFNKDKWLKIPITNSLLAKINIHEEGK